MVDRLKAENDAEVEWRPFVLHPEIPPEGLEMSAQWRGYFDRARGRLEQMANAAGLKFVAPDRLVSSRRALEAAEYAREQGKHEEFHRVVFRKIYGEGQDIGRWDVLHAAAAEVGLDPGEMQTAVASGRYAAAVDAHTSTAHGLGIGGVPTYILNSKYAIVGAQPYEAFQQAIARLPAGET